MSFRSQSSGRGASKQYSKSAHEKKSKDKKRRQTAKYLQEETPQASTQEVTQRAQNSLGKLGSQIFALSPFSQYFDDWLLNLRQVISEFETNPTIKADDAFVKVRTQVFLDLEGALAQNRLDESNLTNEARALSDNNHRIVEADRKYAEQTRELSNKRNSELQRQSSKIRELEDDLAAQQQLKFGFFQFGEKKRAAEKLTQTQQALTTAKNELEVTVQNFTAEQDKLHDAYEKCKQDLSEESDRLHKELEKLETDTSTAARQTACNALVEAINDLLKRTTQAGTESTA
jgi:hypothetical protein